MHATHTMHAAHRSDLPLMSLSMSRVSVARGSPCRVHPYPCYTMPHVWSAGLHQIKMSRTTMPRLWPQVGSLSLCSHQQRLSLIRCTMCHWPPATPCICMHCNATHPGQIKRSWWEKILTLDSAEGRHDLLSHWLLAESWRPHLLHHLCEVKQTQRAQGVRVRSSPDQVRPKWIIFTACVQQERLQGHRIQLLPALALTLTPQQRASGVQEVVVGGGSARRLSGERTTHL
jgi:hypothetical protein